MFENEEDDVGSAIEQLESLKSELIRKTRQFRSTYNRTLKSLSKFLKATLDSKENQNNEKLSHNFENFSLKSEANEIDSESHIQNLKKEFSEILKSLSEIIENQKVAEGKEGTINELREQIRSILGELGENSADSSCRNLKGTEEISHDLLGVNIDLGNESGNLIKEDEVKKEEVEKEDTKKTENDDINNLDLL